MLDLTMTFFDAMFFGGCCFVAGVFFGVGTLLLLSARYHEEIERSKDFVDREFIDWASRKRTSLGSIHERN